MTITLKQELSFFDLTNQCWCEALDTLRTIEELSMEDDLMELLQQYSNAETTLTDINDLLRYDQEWIYYKLGIEED